MAKYRVLRQTLIGDRVHEVGEEVEYDGIPAENLVPLDAAAKKAVGEAEEHFRQERARAAMLANPEAAALGAAVVTAIEKGQGKPEPKLDAPAAPVYRPDEEATAKGGRSKS